MTSQSQETFAVRGLPNAAALRLLLVSSDPYPPTRVDVTVLFGIELAARGHRIDMILQSEAACPRPYMAAWSGGRVWVGATDLGGTLLHRLRKHYLGIRADMRVFPLLRSGEYDFVIVKDKFLSGVAALIAAALFRRRFIYWLSYPFPESYLERARDGTAGYPLLYRLRGTAFSLLLYRVLLPLAAHVFVQSEQMRRDIQRHGLPAAKMTPVPMGIQPATFVVPDDARGPGIEAEHPPSILYLGTLAKIRRLDFLLRVLVRVRAAFNTAQMIFVGRGDEPGDEEFLLQEAHRLQLDVGGAVVFTGQLPRSEALRRVADADVCVSVFRPNPVLYSASPTKLVEYMAMGKAVVANDQPDQRTLIECSGGGYCVPYEEQAFADAIVQILEDPHTAREMGRRGRRYVLEHRSYSVIADLVEGPLRQLAPGPRSEAV